MYDKFKYIHNELNEKTKRKDQQTFRKDLIDRYSNCIITGCNEIVCEACHIIPFSTCEDEDKYSINNGLLLRSDLHNLFDKGYLKINPTTLTVEISEELFYDKLTKSSYEQYNGKKLKIHKNSIPHLTKI
jgi:putative restriction endonuclease